LRQSVGIRLFTECVLLTLSTMLHVYQGQGPTMERALYIIGFPVWNSLSKFFRSNDSTTTLKRRLKLHFFLTCILVPFCLDFSTCLVQFCIVRLALLGVHRQ